MLTGLQDYTLLQWLFLFYVYCFFGWCFESAYVSLCQHRFVNRGFVRLPLLPIYGSGALCILLVCLPYKGHYAIVFLLGVIFPTLMELIAGWAMESMFKMRYWDYSRKKIQIGGYICLSSSIAWGVLSVLLIHVIHPPIGDLAADLPAPAETVITLAVTAVFAADFIQAFRAALDIRHLMEELEHVRAQLDETRVQLELARAEAADRVEELRLQKRQQLLNSEMHRRLAEMNSHYHIRALLRAHPTMSSEFFAGPLRYAKEQAVVFRRAMKQTGEEFREDMKELRDDVREDLAGLRENMEAKPAEVKQAIREKLPDLPEPPGAVRKRRPGPDADPEEETDSGPNQHTEE